jgi:predicted nucleic acid-binding protein
MAGRDLFVIDSSIAVKWFSEEELTKDALGIMEHHVKGKTTLLTTPLLACELANALRHKPGYDQNKLMEAITHYYNLRMQEAPIDLQLLSRATEIAFKGGVTIYDAIPVALADIRDTACITADETQYNRLRETCEARILFLGG